MEIRFIKKNEWKQLLFFNKTEYGSKSIYTNKAYYDWQFDCFTNKNHEEYTVLGMFDKKGSIIGTFGMFFMPYNFKGKDVKGTCMANLIVKKEIRSLGYGFLLLDKASSIGDFAADHSINEKIWLMFMKSGWYGEDLHRFIYIINNESVAKLVDEMVFPESYKVVPNNAEDKRLNFYRVNIFDKDIDVFWSKARKLYPMTINRSSRYLNWRYAKNPFVKYEIFIAKENKEIKSFIILRIEKPRKDKPLSMQVARIVDFISLGEKYDDFVLSEAIKYCYKNKVAFIDYFSSGQKHNKSFKNNGFIDCVKFPYSKIPILLNPVSTKRMRLNFAVKTKNKNMIKNGFNKLNNWYTTKGDGDQDRPY